MRTFIEVNHEIAEIVGQDRNEQREYLRLPQSVRARCFLLATGYAGVQISVFALQSGILGKTAQRPNDSVSTKV